MGLTKATDGAAKLLKAAMTARDASSAGPAFGSGYVMPAARTGGVGNTQLSTWGITKESMDAWTLANKTTAGDTHKWWVAARAVSKACQDWHTKWTNDSTKLTAGNAAFAETEVKWNTDTASGACNSGSNPAGGTWGNNAANDAPTCKTACQEASRGMLIDPDASGMDLGGGKNANEASKVMAKYSGASTYCAGWSFETGNASKCKLLSAAVAEASRPVPVSSGATANAADRCFQMTTPAPFWEIQNTLQSAYATVTATNEALQVAMKNEIIKQVLLEKAWLTAWYKQQYWAALANQLNVVSADTTQAKTITALKADVDKDDPATTCTKGAKAARDTADTKLTDATDALAKLQTTTAEAAAVVADLGKRIIRADAAIAELDALANAQATGTLDAAAALRVKEWTDYKGVAGEATLAASAKLAAEGAVKPRSGAQVTDGGKLTEDRAVAQGTWDAAKLAAQKAQTDLT